MQIAVNFEYERRLNISTFFFSQLDSCVDSCIDSFFNDFTIQL